MFRLPICIDINGAAGTSAVIYLACAERGLYNTSPGKVAACNTDITVSIADGSVRCNMASGNIQTASGKDFLGIIGLTVSVVIYHTLRRGQCPAAFTGNICGLLGRDIGIRLLILLGTVRVGSGGICLGSVS